MLSARRVALALSVACLSLGPFASAALAAGPATVTVRVEGSAETLLAPTQVTTTTEPVVKDGKAEDSCLGTSALGALQLATGGNWSGPWNGKFTEYEIYSIDGESHEFEPGAPANYYWSFWLDEEESPVGACGAELHPGDRLLFFPACYGAACPPNPTPLGIEAPASANVGEPVVVTVKKYSASGEGADAPGATVTGADAPATTDASGRAALTFCHPGEATVRVSAPNSVRTEAAIHVQAGTNGSCGTQTASGSTGSGSSTSEGGVAGFKAAASPYKGPYALVADVTDLTDGQMYKRGRAPRVLSGSIRAHSAVSSVSLELRREYKGRCSAYEGVRERFLHARCGQGSVFKVSSDGAFSYLLPAALAPGRYVLDVYATDVAGNRTALDRGSSRIVFYVR